MIEPVLNFVRPPEDADPKIHRRWRANIALGVGALLIAVGWAYGPRGFAWAGDVKKQVKEEVAPIVATQATQGAKLDRVERLLTDQLASSVATQIRLVISKRCKTQGFVEREELNREKDRLQDEYVLYKGTRYIEPTCADL